MLCLRAHKIELPDERRVVEAGTAERELLHRWWNGRKLALVAMGRKLAKNWDGSATIGNEWIPTASYIW